MKPNSNTTILAECKGEDSTFFISKYSKSNLYDICFVKNKYTKNPEICKQDVMTVPFWKLKDLACWILNAEKEKAKWDSYFWENTNGHWMNCDCHCEWMRTEIIEFEKTDEETMVCFEMYEPIRFKWFWGRSRKYCSEVVTNYKDAKIFAKRILELKEEKI